MERQPGRAILDCTVLAAAQPTNGGCRSCTEAPTAPSPPAAQPRSAGVSRSAGSANRKRSTCCATPARSNNAGRQGRRRRAATVRLEVELAVSMRACSRMVRLPAATARLSTARGRRRAGGSGQPSSSRTTPGRRAGRAAVAAAGVVDEPRLRSSTSTMTAGRSWVHAVSRGGAPGAPHRPVGVEDAAASGRSERQSSPSWAPSPRLRGRRGARRARSRGRRSASSPHASRRPRAADGPRRRPAALAEDPGGCLGGLAEAVHVDVAAWSRPPRPMPSTAGRISHT